MAGQTKRNPNEEDTKGSNRAVISSAGVPFEPRTDRRTELANLRGLGKTLRSIVKHFKIYDTEGTKDSSLATGFGPPPSTELHQSRFWTLGSTRLSTLNEKVFYSPLLQSPAFLRSLGAARRARCVVETANVFSSSS